MGPKIFGFFYPRDVGPSKRGICYGNVAGWVSVTRRYCIKRVIIISGTERNGGTHCDWPVDRIGLR